MKTLVLVASCLAAASATYLPAGASPLGLVPSQQGLPLYPYGVGLGSLLPYAGLQSYPYPHPYSYPYSFPLVPAQPQTPAAVAVSAAPAPAAAAPAPSAAAAPAAEQKSLASVAPAVPAVPVPEVQPVDAPKPVEETPEVKQARERFMALWTAAAKAAAESPDTGDAPAAESAPSRRRRDVTAGVRSWGYGAAWPTYPHSYSAPLAVASAQGQPVVYPGGYNYYY